MSSALFTQSRRLAQGLLLLVLACNPFDNPDPNAFDDEPAWSPDGRTIAYVRYHSDNPGLYLVSPEGRDNRLLLAGQWTTPAWSPDSRWLAFSVAYAGAMYKVKADGDSLTLLTDEGMNFFSDWSVTDRIAYDSNKDNPGHGNLVWVMDKDGRERRNISEKGVGEWRSPSWSPDGSRLAFCRYYDGYPFAELALMDSSGHGVTRLTVDSLDDRAPAWSPDGSVVAVSSGLYHYRIRLVNVSDGSWSWLPPSNAVAPTWSPRGDQICFATHETDSLHEGWSSCKLWVMNRDGNNARQLTR